MHYAHFIDNNNMDNKQLVKIFDIVQYVCPSAIILLFQLPQRIQIAQRVLDLLLFNHCSLLGILHLVRCHYSICKYYQGIILVSVCQ